MKQSDYQEANTEQEQAEKEQAGQEKKEKNIKKEIFSYVRAILAGIIIAWAVGHFVIINAEIPSESMMDRIQVGDRIFGLRLSYVFSDPERYDIVIFHYPVDGTAYIKRIIGLPGETVEIRDAKIYIDGSETPLKEDYLPEKWVYANDGYVFEVPKDSYLMLGDNRNVSLDARFWAEEAMNEGLADTEEEAREYTYVKKDEIMGEAMLKYYPKFDWLMQ